MRGGNAVRLDRRGFVRLSSCAAGLVWATPAIRSVAPARAGTPPPTPTSAPPVPLEPPQVESEVATPPEPAEVAAGAAAAKPDVHAEVLGVRDPLAVTGTEIGQLTALGVGALVSGFGLRYAAGRMDTDEVRTPDGDAPGASSG